MKVVTCGNHTECEDDDWCIADEEAEPPTKEVGDSAEDEGTEDHADNGEGKQVVDIVGLEFDM